MLKLPTLWDLIVSTVVFFAAAWYIRNYLDEQGIPSSYTRGILVFTLASLLSWGAGAAVDRLTTPRAGQHSDAAQLLKAAARQQP